MLVVIGTDFKSNYHMITTMMAPAPFQLNWNTPGMIFDLPVLKKNLHMKQNKFWLAENIFFLCAFEQVCCMSYAP